MDVSKQEFHSSV